MKRCLIFIVLVAVGCSNQSVKVKSVSGKDSKITAAEYEKKREMPASVSKEYVEIDAQAAVSGDTADVKSDESYDKIQDNKIIDASKENKSTFSIDVDTAAYSNMRRFVEGGSLPPKDSVRIEELINYFNYDYPSPDKGAFSVSSELFSSPWNKNKVLLKIGIQGKKIDFDKMPPMNLVFLVDTSGSMGNENKLPLLIKSFTLLAEKLRDKDHIAIVAYASAAGLVLPPTSGKDRKKIIEALNNLSAGGSTAGGEGLQLAYSVAKKYFNKQGNNRIILATDGDFNVGASSDDDMVKQIERERKHGIYISVLGFGMGNLKDSKMEKIADKGNGNYAYIDNFREAKKVLLEQMAGTLVTIAKDVKLQLEFDKKLVKNYRLIGYENRVMANKDFDDDKKDAGELGAGHTVTALYEIELNKTAQSLGTLRIRYKAPNSDSSVLSEFPLAGEIKADDKISLDSRFIAAVAEYGLLLRNSEYKGNSSFESVLKNAK